MKASEIAKDIIKNKIPADLKKSFSEIKQQLLESCKKNGYGCSDDIQVKEKGYSLFYTENSNYQQGEKNGGGRGFYAKLYFTGM